MWLGPRAPADAVARLTRAGLLVQSERTETARVATLGRQGPALGLLLLLVCAIAAAVLAVGGTAVSLLADARRRSFELAALRVVGVPQRTLRRSAVAEQALLLSAAVVLGLPSGYAAAALALPLVPEFSDPTTVVLRYQPSIPIALACAAGFALLLWITAQVAGRALARAAVPARLARGAAVRAASARSAVRAARARRGRRSARTGCARPPRGGRRGRRSSRGSRPTRWPGPA